MWKGKGSYSEGPGKERDGSGGERCKEEEGALGAVEERKCVGVGFRGVKEFWEEA